MELKDYTTEELKAELKRRVELERARKAEEMKKPYGVGTVNTVCAILIGVCTICVWQERGVKNILAIIL